MSAAPGPIFLDLPGEPAAAGVVRDVLRSLVHTSPNVRLTPQEFDEVCIAVQEACTNAVRHGCGGRPGSRFRVEVYRHADALELRVRDSGPIFEFSKPELPDPEALQEGGYGTFIMHSWMHEVDVTREGQQNVVRLVRRYGVPVGASGAADE